jgi:hypothetical protein
MTDVAKLSKDFNDLKTALQELGVVGNAYGKTAGIMEKQQGKLKAAFNKNPIVQVGKSFMGLGKQVKIFNKLQTQSTQLTEEQKAEVEKNATGLTKWMVTIVGATAYGKMMNKMVENQVSLWRRLTMNIFAILSIFLLVGFAIAAVSVAFQGAETPLLDYTEGIPILDEALKGLIMAMTGEGEGGLYGAINLVVAAMVLALPVMFLFGFQAGLISGSLLLIIGAYQLVKKETGSTTAAFATAAAIGMVLVGVFLYLKASLVIVGSAAQLAKAALMQTIGSVLLGVGLIIGGIVGLWAFITGRVDGWLGWLVGAISSAAIAVGLAILGVIAWPAVAIAAVLIFIVALVIKYWDEIVALGVALGEMIWGGLTWIGEWVGAIVAGIIAVILGAISLVVAILYGFASLILIILLTPFKIIYDVLMDLFTSFTVALSGGWKSVVAWLVGVPSRVIKIAKKSAEGVVNVFIKGFNWLANKMKITIPKWVPKIGGKSFKIPSIPKVKLAKGGIVNKPTNALIGEDGPEAVIPLTKKNNPQGIGLGGGGPITININASGITDRTDKRALAREIGEAIRDEMNRSGRGYGNRRGAL